MWDEDDDDPRYDDGSDDDYPGNDVRFADPGGRSALRAGVRRFSCPTCRQPNKLTKKDKELGYQCDACADRAEGRHDGYGPGGM
jgi:hypothetical protein